MGAAVQIRGAPNIARSAGFNLSHHTSLTGVTILLVPGLAAGLLQLFGPQLLAAQGSVSWVARLPSSGALQALLSVPLHRPKNRHDDYSGPSADTPAEALESTQHASAGGSAASTTPAAASATSSQGQQNQAAEAGSLPPAALQPFDAAPWDPLLLRGTFLTQALKFAGTQPLASVALADKEGVHWFPVVVVMLDFVHIQPAHLEPVAIVVMNESGTVLKQTLVCSIGAAQEKGVAQP